MKQYAVLILLVLSLGCHSYAIIRAKIVEDSYTSVEKVDWRTLLKEFKSGSNVQIERLGVGGTIQELRAVGDIKFTDESGTFEIYLYFIDPPESLRLHISKVGFETLVTTIKEILPEAEIHVLVRLRKIN